jgi:hypothetical protein
MVLLPLLNRLEFLCEVALVEWMDDTALEDTPKSLAKFKAHIVEILDQFSQSIFPEPAPQTLQGISVKLSICHDEAEVLGICRRVSDK